MDATSTQAVAPWVARATELGAAGAAIVATSSVVTAQWVRLKCQYGCAGYGRRLTCPPYSPTPDTTRRMLDEYRFALLVHSTGNHYGVPVKQLVAQLERELFLAGHYKAFAFGSGPCGLCDACNLEYCAHTSEARPAMEAAGVDVYATARAGGFPIEVVKDHSCPQNYYGLVLVE